MVISKGEIKTMEMGVMTFSDFIAIVRTALPWCFAIGGLLYLFDSGGDFKDPGVLFGLTMISVAAGCWMIL